MWADGKNEQNESLGNAFICLRKLADAKFTDRTFTDQKTRKKINF